MNSLARVKEGNVFKEKHTEIQARNSEENFLRSFGEASEKLRRSADRLTTDEVIFFRER